MATEYTIRPFTTEEFMLAYEAGAFGEDNVELLDGEVILMPPTGDGHDLSMLALTQVLVTRLLGRALVLPEGSFKLAPHSLPRPDFSVLIPPLARYRGHKAEVADVFALIEVSETSLAYDRGRKRAAYACHGVPEYWIVDTVNDRIEVHREPHELGFRSIRTHRRGERVAFAAFPDIEFTVDEILGYEEETPTR